MFHLPTERCVEGVHFQFVDADIRKITSHVRLERDVPTRELAWMQYMAMKHFEGCRLG
jgi:hypothetical protein